MSRRGIHRTAEWVWEKCASDTAMLLAVPLACAAVIWDAATTTEIADSDQSSSCRYPPARHIFGADQVRQLERNGFVVVKGVDCELAQARTDVQSIIGEGRFDTSTNDSDVRQDRICWVRESDGTAQGGSGGKGFLKLGDGLLHCVKVLRSIPHALEEHGYSVSHEHRVPKQLQLSCYAGDRRCEYVEHLDHCNATLSELGVLEWLRTSDYRSRCITAILYLNPREWGDKPPMGAIEDGGQLRIFHRGTDKEDERRDKASASGSEAAAASGAAAAGAAASAAQPADVSVLGVAEQESRSYTDVVPKGGTLVVFDSRRMRHQVLPSTQQRLALTCWVTGTSGEQGGDGGAEDTAEGKQ